MNQPTLINLHPNDYSQELHYYLFAVNLDRCVGSGNTINDLPKVCVLSVFNMITGINESKTLTKHVSCEFKCKFDGRKCSSNPKWNNDKCCCECKNPKKHLVCKKIIFGILLHKVVKMINIWQVLLTIQ